jgi:hypothetical protein
MTSFDVVPKDTTIDDDQLRKIKQEIPPDIFYYLSKDRKTLTLKGSNYEKLSVAKNKSELTLGLQKKTNNARRMNHYFQKMTLNNLCSGEMIYSLVSCLFDFHNLDLCL